MKKSRDQSDDASMTMTPMIDVTFLLLVFFMCTLQFKTLEGKLGAYLPKELGLSDRPPVDRPIEITVRMLVREPGRRVAAATGEAWPGRGRYRLEERRLVYRVGPVECADLAQLEQRLRTLRGADDTRPLVLDPGADALHDEVVAVIDRARSAGFDAVDLAGAEGR